MKKKIPEVMSERKIIQRLAGYKAAYSRKIFKCTSRKEREILEEYAESYANAMLDKLLEQNKKAKQILAGYKSWETRRKNAVEKENDKKLSDFNEQKKIGRKFNSKIYDGNLSFKM